MKESDFTRYVSTLCRWVHSHQIHTFAYCDLPNHLKIRSFWSAAAFRDCITKVRRRPGARDTWEWELYKEYKHKGVMQE